MPARRKPAVRRRKAPVRRRKALANVNSKITSIVETIEPDFSILTNVASYWSCGLASFPRALAMSKLFEFFRIVKFKVISKPRANMFFNIAGANSVQAPQMYRCMDRGRILSQAYITLDTMVAQGAKPTLFTKDYSVSYKPNTLAVANVLGGDAIDGEQTPLYQTNEVCYGKWFPTTPNPSGNILDPNPNTLDAAVNAVHYGHWQYLHQLGDTTNTRQDYSVVVMCTIQFKNPLKLPAGASQGITTALPYTVTFGNEETFSERPQHGHTGGVWS